MEEQRRQALLSYADVLEKNATHLHWLEGILVGKEARVGLYEVSSVGDMFRCERSVRGSTTVSNPNALRLRTIDGHMEDGSC